MSEEVKKRLTPVEWAKAEAYYESGEYTLEEISSKFSVHVATVQRHMRKRGIEKGAKAEEIKKKVEETLEDQAAKEAELVSRRIQETKEEHYRLSQAIDKRIAREFVEAAQTGRAIASSMENFKALKEAAATLKITRESRYTILGMNEEDRDIDDLPTLEVREMLDEEVAAIRDAQKKDAEELGLEG